MTSLVNIGIACLFLTTPTWAQYLISARAGLINFAEGDVYVEEKRLQFSANNSTILKVGESLSTGFGLVEIQLGPGAYLRMGSGGVLKMENADLTNMQVQVSRGSIMVEIFDEVDDNEIRIHFRDATFDLKKKGLYRVDCSMARLRVYVGKAEILQSQEKTTLKKGEAAVLGDSKVSEFDTEEKDLLHQWAAGRSFILYIINRNNRQRWNHWTHLNGGWMQNEYYGMQAHSPIAEQEQVRLQAQERQRELEQRAQRLELAREKARRQAEESQRQVEEARRRAEEARRQAEEPAKGLKPKE